MRADGQLEICETHATYGPVTFLYRPMRSFRPFSVRRRLGFSIPELNSNDETFNFGDQAP